MLHSLARLVWFSFAALVVAAAIALSAARILLPEMADYREELESVAARYLRAPVHIGALDAAWHGMSPVLRLQQVAVEDERLPGGRLEVVEVQVVFDVLESLRHLQWRTAGIEIIGVDLQVETGVRPLPAWSELVKPFRWILQQDSIVLREMHVRILDSRLGRQPANFSLDLLRLVSHGRRHQLLVEATVPELMGGSLYLAADVTGDVNRPETWNGKSYLRTGSLRPAFLQPWLDRLPLDPRGEADVELWLDVRAGQFEQVHGSLAARRLFGLTADGQQAGGDALSTSFQVLREDGRWRVALHGFELERDGATVWPASDVSLTIVPADITSIRGHASRIVLQEARPFLSLLPWIGSRTRAMVDDLNVAGTLDDVDFGFELVPGAAPRFSLRARFDGLSAGGRAGLPGVRNLSGTIEGNLQAGLVRLDTAGAVLSMPAAFTHDLALDALSGRVQWTRYRNLFRLDSRALRVRSGPLAASAAVTLDWPYGGTPWLDLRMALEDFPLQEVRNFLPENIMRPRAVAWLRNAFRAGTARGARFLFQGRLDEAPFDQAEGRLEARFDFDDVVLAYHPRWGRLDDLGGSALFVGRSMTITGNQGRIMDAPVEQVVARIDDFKHPLLKIRGTVGGTLAGMLEYVEVSPLGERFGRLLENLDAEGDANLQLVLDIPLVPPLGAVSVSGDVHLDGNTLRNRFVDLPLENLHGVLHFSNRGLSARKVSGRLLGQPVRVDVRQQGSGADSKTLVEARGKLGLVRRLKQTQSVFSPYLDGGAQWQLQLAIRNRMRKGEPPVVVRLDSDLTGISSSLPAPFAKAAGESRPLQLEWAPGQDRPVSVVLAGRVRAQVLPGRDWSSLRRVAIRFGGGRAVLPDQDRLELSGRLDRLDVPAWVAVFANHTGGGAGSVPPLAVRLELASLRLFGYAVREVTVTSRSQDPWYFLVKGEGAEGWLRWVPGGLVRSGQLLANFDHLVLEALPEAESKRTADGQALDPRKLPELDLRAGKLDWNGRDLGRVYVSSKHGGDGVVFDRIELDSEAVVLKGNGTWKERNGRQTSGFSATFSGGELGKLVEMLGEQGSIEGGRIQEGSVRLDWPGSPADFSIEYVEGDISIKVKDGRLDTVKEGAGKLLHLISLNSLQRRLTLDFTDLFKGGFSFDTMRGSFVITDGNAFTDGFKIKGPSAIIEISGRTGLIARDYDQMVIVTPQVSSSLPIAGVIAGGPVVGAAALLVERLMGQKFNRMVQVRYQVTGTWDHPVITRLERKESDTGLDTEAHPGDYNGGAD